MIITASTGLVAWHLDEILGLVRGRATWCPSDEGVGIEHGIEDARARAVEALQSHARKLAADAVIGLRTELVELSAGAILVRVWGKAVVAGEPKILERQDDVAAEPPDVNRPARPSAAGSGVSH